MADAGSIGTFRGCAVARPLPVWAAGSAAVGTVKPALALMRPIPVWVGGNTVNLHLLPIDDAIAGTITHADMTVAAGKIVRLYDRISGLLVATTKTDASGNYRFDALNAVDRYYVVAMYGSPRVVPNYNAVVADNLTPQ